MLTESLSCTVEGKLANKLTQTHGSETFSFQVLKNEITETNNICVESTPAAYLTEEISLRDVTGQMKDLCKTLLPIELVIL